MKKLLTILIASSFIVGCASTTSAPEPKPDIAHAGKHLLDTHRMLLSIWSRCAGRPPAAPRPLLLMSWVPGGAPGGASAA